MARIELHRGSITKLQVDAIVNAAKESLLGGGGVDGAIHRAAGPELLAECKKLNGCQTGDAKITKGYNLPAKHVIHTVGPVWGPGEKQKDALLASCYRKSLEVAVLHGVKSIAFPCISTGAYMFPPERAAKIAITEVRSFLETHPQISRVVFVTFTEANYQYYMGLL